MISLLIKITTIILILVAFGTIEKKKNIVYNIFRCIKNTYLSLLNSWGPITKFLMKVYCVFMELQFFIITFQKCCLDEGKIKNGKYIIMSVLLWILVSFIMYVGFGSILAIFSKTADNIGNVKNSKISTKMMISFSFLTFFMFISFVSEEEMKENLVFLFAGLVTSYILNIQVLLKIVQNPFCLLEDEKNNKSENRTLIIFSSVLIVLMIIINMYLLVLWTYFSFESAYVCTTGDKVITKWKLLYYTIISFTTIGYGDVSPVIFESQAVAILIAITSVMCLGIFVSSVLSEKNEILKKNQGKRQDTLN